MAVRAGQVSVYRKSHRLVFTIDETKYSFTILGEDDTNINFEECIANVHKLVDNKLMKSFRNQNQDSSPAPPDLHQPPPASDSRNGTAPTRAPSDSAPATAQPQPSSTLNAPGGASSMLRPVSLSPNPHYNPATPPPATASSTSNSTNSRQNLAPSKRSEFFLFVEVSDPQVEGETATYLVTHNTNMPEFHILEGSVRRRYSQFELLHTGLMQKFSKLSSVPELPSKTWFKRVDKAFLDQRTRELNTWLKAIALDEYMHRASELVLFLTDQAPVPVAGPAGYVEKLMRPLVENQVMAGIGDTINGTVQSMWNKNASTNPLLIGSPLERDYHAARGLMEQWKLAPKKLPFPKFVTLILGSTSSGKSAFVNHHFGCVVRKSTDHQQDTDFTVVEVIPAAEFYALAGTKSRVTHKSQAMLHPDAKDIISDDDLQRPIDDYESDWRTGRVFIRLNSNQLLARYEQLKPYSKDGLFRACLINEAALDRNAPYFDLACNSILIDSPGFSTIQSAEIAEKFRGTLVVLQYLYNMCDLLLYFVPCGQISTLAQHLPMLELALTYASHGEKIGDEMLKTLFSHQVQESNKSGGFLSFCSSIASSILKQASPSGQSSSTSSDQSFKGANVWYKTLFILSKVDILFRQTEPSQWYRILLSQYYELGVLLGSSLSLLDAPVHDQCLTIGLPEFQRNLRIKDAHVAPTADLDLLTAKMQGREQEAPYIERLEMAIQQMCADLEKAMSASYYTMGQYQMMVDLRSRSEARNKARQTGVVPNSGR